jgi:hypothetical protein
VSSSALPNWRWRRVQRIERVRSHHKYFLAVSVAVTVGVEPECVGSDRRFVYIEQ